MRSKEEVMTKLQEWLTTRNPRAKVGFTQQTDIIEERILESLQFVEFIMLLESLVGEPVLTEELDPNRLRTLNTIWAEFFCRKDDT